MKAWDFRGCPGKIFKIEIDNISSCVPDSRMSDLPSEL